MPRRAAIIAESEAPPDPHAAAEAILPLFLAFLNGRRARPGTPSERDHEARRPLPAQLEGS